MIKTAEINGTLCRYYFAGKVYVSKDGTVAGVPNNRWGGYRQLNIIDDRGRKFIKVNKNKSIRLDLAVMRCFGSPMPVDGKRYMINHKDGDGLNCDVNNLEWAIHHYEHTAEDSIVLNCCGNRITAFKDGHIEMDGKTMMVHDSLYDPDIELEVCIDPHIAVSRPRSIYHERVDIDKIMNVAGYIQGDDMILSCPQILHIDNDWKNFSSDNLMWVEYDDERFKSYQLKKKEDKHKRNVELNPGKELYHGM